MVKPTNASVEPYRLIYRVRHKHLTVFKILKSECPQCAASILTFTIYSDVWGLVEMERWSVHHRIAAVELVITTESVTVTPRGFRQQFQRHDAPGSIVGIEIVPRRISERE